MMAATQGPGPQHGTGKSPCQPGIREETLLERGNQDPFRGSCGEAPSQLQVGKLSQYKALGWRTLLSAGHHLLAQGWTVLVLVKKECPASWNTLLEGHAGEGWV